MNDDDFQDLQCNEELVTSDTEESEPEDEEQIYETDSEIDTITNDMDTDAEQSKAYKR